MKKSCALFKRGKCLDKACKYLHGPEDMKKLALIEEKEKKKNQNDPLRNFSNYFNIEEIIRKKLIDKREEDVDVICQDFLNGACKKINCELVHNFSLKNKSQNISKFQECLNSFKNDFKLIEPYEAKLIGGSSLDLLFICDCTGSMGPWIEKTKNSIYSIVNYIKEHNKHSSIRIGFVAYRDFCDSKRFEVLEFTEKVVTVFNFISRLNAEGGGDEPEDVTGGLIQGLKLDWKSKARYAILIADAPDHGYTDRLCNDSYPQSEFNSMELKEAIKCYAMNDINFYAVEINCSTKYMFEVMSENYQEIAMKPIHVEKLDECEEKFAFFVAYGASTTLTSVSYSKLDFMQLIRNFKTFSLQTVSLSKDYDKLNASEKSVVDFIRKINQNLDQEEENVSGFEIIKKDTFGLFSDTINSLIIVNDLIYPEDLEERMPLADFDDISEIEVEAICHSFNIVKDFNAEINWKNPYIQQSQIHSNVKIDLTPFAKGQMRYAYYMYDTYLNQNLVGKLPIKYKASEYSLEFLSKDIESLIVSDHIAKEFNDRIINYVKDTRLLLNFVKAYVYEINYKRENVKNYIDKNHTNRKTELKEEMLDNFMNDQIVKNNYNLFSVENYIDGSYEKYNNNAGWITGNLNEASFVTQAFSHFTWQYTKGFLMIVDLQGVGGILTDPQIHCMNGKKYGKGNLGYLGMMKFFLTHTCNRYCLALNLINPKKFERKLDENFDFFVEKIKIPLNKKKLVNKCCDLCKEPAIFSEYFLYRMKRSGKECFCNTCLENLKKTVVKKECKMCNNEFVASEYGFKLKRIQIPENCSECRLAIRNKLRQEKENLSANNNTVIETQSDKIDKSKSNSSESLVVVSDLMEEISISVNSN